MRSRRNLGGSETDELVLELGKGTEEVGLGELSELVGLELVLLVLHFRVLFINNCQFI